MIHPITKRARSLRKRQTEAESRLWYHLRSRGFYGVKFKRQEPLGPYFVDFVSHERKVIVEVDGSHHAEKTQEEYDQIRTEYLKSMGYKVVRFWNKEIFSSLDGVLERLYHEVFGNEESFDTLGAVNEAL